MNLRSESELKRVEGQITTEENDDVIIFKILKIIRHKIRWVL